MIEWLVTYKELISFHAKVHRNNLQHLPAYKSMWRVAKLANGLKIIDSGYTHIYLGVVTKDKIECTEFREVIFVVFGPHNFSELLHGKSFPGLGQGLK